MATQSDHFPGVVLYKLLHSWGSILGSSKQKGISKDRCQGNHSPTYMVKRETLDVTVATREVAASELR